MNSKDSIEMKEIKVSKGKALLHFLGRHIVACYLFFVIAVLFYGCVAKAEGTDDYLSQIEATYFNNINSSNTAIIEGLISQYDLNYFFIGRSGGTVGDITSRPSQAILLFTNTDEIYLERFLRCNSSPSYEGIRDTYYNDTSSLYFAFNNSYSVNVWSNYTDSPYTGTVHGIAIWQDYGGSPWGIQFVMTFNNGVSSGYSYSSIGSMNSGNTNYSNAFSVGNYISYGNYYAFSPVTSGGQCYYCHSSIEMIPSYSDDNRLKFAKINSTYDGEVLMTDIRQFMADFPIQDTSHSSAYLDPESITLKYTVDGTEKTITLDNSNSTIRSKYIFETPVYEFDFDDDNTSVIITNADFTIYGTSQSSPYETSETYRISCEYYIVRPVQPIQPTVIPTPVYNDPNVKTQQDITQIVYYLNNWSSSHSGGEFLMMNDIPDLPSWADRYTDTLYRFTNDSSPSVAGEFTTLPTYSSLSGWNYDIIDVYDYIADIIDVYDNVYDVFIFPVDYWYVTDTVTTPDYTDRGIQGYIVFLSERYFSRQIGFNSIDILDILQISSDNDILFFENVRAKLDDFEYQTLNVMGLTLDIEKDSLSWLKTIDNSIKSIEPFDDSSILGVLYNIYDAISGWGGTDTSRIETKLDTLINHFLANNSQENSAYKQFVTWLRDVEGKPVQYVTTGFSFFTELFDYFPFTKDLDGSGGFSNMFDMGKGFIDLSTGHTTGIPENYQGLSYYFNSANDGSYNVSSMSGR